ncbi:MAG: vWA domain-containing protein [Rubripirellula sp.]
MRVGYQSFRREWFPLVGLAFLVGCGAQPSEGVRVGDVDTAEYETSAAPRSVMPHPIMPGSAAPDAGMPMPASDAEEAPIDGVADQGSGAGDGGEQYDAIVDNPFLRVLDQPLSTFSIDVDTASYSKVRQYLVNYQQMPRPAAVRIEELLNYFQYEYSSPTPDQTEPFATHVAVTQCPWNGQHRLVRLALKGREVTEEARPASNLVLLIDTSGSMKQANKLPLLKKAMQMLLSELDERDCISVVAYAGSAGLVLDGESAADSAAILRGLDRLQAGGSTNGGRGLQLAYQAAREHFVEGGTNRVLLCTDGDFNVGMTGTDQMIDLVESEAKQGIELTVLGFGMGNLNDAMLEQISGRGNGNYAFIDTYNEAKKVLVDQLAGTLVTIAKDVKLQIEFNPGVVAAYRLIGYENRLLASEDFNDDKKDAGEIGAGHSVTAFYEVIPVGVSTESELPETDALKYQEPPRQSAAAESGELLTLKLRYKMPEQEKSQLMEHVVYDSGATFAQADREFQFAAAVAGFGMLLRGSEHRGDWSFDSVMQVAENSTGTDPHGLREEFVELVSIASHLAQ